MRKVLFILLSVLILVGCNKTATEEKGIRAEEEKPDVEEIEENNGLVLGLKEFSNEYNAQAERLNNENNGIPHLELINISHAESTFDESEHWHNVLSDSDDLSNYGIELTYDDQMNILEYHVGLSADDGHSHFQSAGIASASIIAEVLGLDLDLYLDNTKRHFEVDDISHKYEDAGYEILFMDLGAGESDTLTFEFRRLE